MALVDNWRAIEVGQVAHLHVFAQDSCVSLLVGLDSNGIDLNNEQAGELAVALGDPDGGSCGTQSGRMLRIDRLPGGVEIKQGSSKYGWRLPADQGRLLVGLLEQAIEIVKSR